MHVPSWFAHSEEAGHPTASFALWFAFECPTEMANILMHFCINYSDILSPKVFRKVLRKICFWMFFVFLVITPRRSVNQPTLRNNPENRRIQVNRSGSLVLAKSVFLAVPTADNFRDQFIRGTRNTDTQAVLCYVSILCRSWSSHPFNHISLSGLFCFHWHQDNGRYRRHLQYIDIHFILPPIHPATFSTAVFLSHETSYNVETPYN